MNKTVRGTSVKTENPSRAGKGAECEEVTEFDPTFLRGAIAVSQQGGSVESYAEAYQGSVKLVRPSRSE
jgi:hypothetical protein